MSTLGHVSVSPNSRKMTQFAAIRDHGFGYGESQVVNDKSPLIAKEKATRPFFLGVDLGGTNIKAGVVDDHGRPLSRESIPTEAERGPEHGVARICQVARQAMAEARVDVSDIVGVGVGSPGSMDLIAQILIAPHNLPGWRNVPLATLVGEKLGLPAVLQNDANAAAFGEYWAGAGRGTKSLVQFTLGTGIGCGIVLDGQILEGRHSHGAECGHLRIDVRPNARWWGTGLRGSLEAYASATAVVKRTEESLAEGAEAPVLRPLLPTLSEDEKCAAIFGAADRGDPLAVRIVDETAFYLAVGAVNLMHTIDPDVVVYSGGMIAAGPPFLDRIKRYIRENALPVPGERTRVCYAELGTDAGFIGAAGCARRTFATSASSPTSTMAKAR
jgi:glucokinase